MEEWRAIPEATGYQVSSDGRIRSVDRTVIVGGQSRRYSGRLIAATANQYGHLKVPLRVAAGKPKMFYIHALVAEAFIGPRPDGQEVAHNDGNPTNNCVGNLRYATPAENQADRHIHGTRLVRSEHPSAQLSESDVAAIIRRLAAGTTQGRLAREYGIARTTISAIATGRSWR